MSLSLTADNKMILFIFLGIVIAILVLGYHKSPVASPALGNITAGNQPRNSSPSVTPTGMTYPSNKSMYK